MKALNLTTLLVNQYVRVSRLLRSLALLWFAVTVTPEKAFAHATLISSSPANGSSVAVSPAQIRLVFSEPIELSMCRVLLVQGKSTTELSVSADPRNVNALTAKLETLSAGMHEVKWQALSADGHTVSGVLRFTVGSPIATVVGADTSDAHSVPAADAESSQQKAITAFAMLFRGIGLTALLAFVGLLGFTLRREQGTDEYHVPLATTLALLAAIALVIHLILWMCHSFAVIGDADYMTILLTSAGKREGLRTVLAMLALWAWSLASRPRLAFAIAAAGVMASAMIGHAAAINPSASIAFKLIHLAAAAIWLGGLFWILCQKPADTERFRRETKRVSSAAGWCAALILVSGVVQTGIILSWNSTSLRSTYAVVAALKLVGFAILAGIGGLNRFRILPMLEKLAHAGSLQRSVRREISIMIIVAMLGGVLSYMSPPEQSDGTHSMEMRK